MLIRYIGELLDPTGYGEAARYNVALLHKMGHRLQCVSTTHNDISRLSNNWKNNIIKNNIISLDNTTLPKPDLIITHIYPPKHILKYKIEGVPLYAYVAWETNLLPSSWAFYLNKYVDKIITTCSEMKLVFEKVCTKPVYVLGPTYFKEDLDNIDFKTKLKDVDNDTDFKFYSVFQWIERKDPEKLISAFVQEFDNSENVSLILKTYRLSYDKSEFEVIVNTIKRITNECVKFVPPKVIIIPKLLSELEMEQLHNACDCYVSPNRGEGTGLGLIDAAIHSKQIITTAYGGPSDFLNFTGDHTPYSLDYNMVAIQNPLYCYNYFNSNMKWADVNIEDLKIKMRKVFDNRFNSNKEYVQKQKRDVEAFYSESRNTLIMKSIID